MAVIVALSILNAPLAALAQGRVEKQPTKLESQFGINRSDLIAKDGSSVRRESPLAEDNSQEVRGMIAQSTLRPDIVSATSVENFQGTQNNLSNTHDSAQGFLSWWAGWGYQANFHNMDAGVSTWLFHDYNALNRNYDLWSSAGIDYGIDAARVHWHSSHGALGSNIFYTSMGANWDNTGWFAQSNLMALGGNHNSYGDERLRYIFWDTCDGIKVTGGNDPYSTWGPQSRGIRFIFGYATVSVDSPNYGRFFGEEWDKGKTLTYAFLDANQRISTGQAPIAMAFGANEVEAVNRRETERYFYPDSVSNYWAAWRWYNTVSASRPSPPEAIPALTPQAGNFDVAKRGNSNREVAEIARDLGIELPNESAIQTRSSGIKIVQTNALTLAVQADGSFELLFNDKEDGPSADPVLSDESLISRAEEMANQLGFAKGQNLRAGSIRSLNENAGTLGYTGEPRVVEKTVVFDQTINGTSFIDPEAGHLEITFGARSGQVKRLRNTLKGLQPSPKANAATPVQAISQQEARQKAISEFSKAAGGNTALISSVEIVEGSEAIGYYLIDGQAKMVYRALLTSSATPGMRPFQAIIPLQK